MGNTNYPLKSLSSAAILILSLAGFASAQTPSSDAIPASDAGGAPITIWGNPVQGGPLDVVFIYPQSGAADIDHLETRLGLRSIRVPFDWSRTDSKDVESRPVFGDSAAAALEAALRKPHEVVLLSRLNVDDLPRSARAQLYSLLRKGTNLVVVGYDAEDDHEPKKYLEGLELRDGAHGVVDGAGTDLLSGWRDGLDRLRLYEGIDRRAAEIAYAAAAPRTHCLIPLAERDAMHASMTLDNYLSLVGRTLRWAAGREPSLRIIRLESLAPTGPEDIDTPPQLPEKFIQRMRDASITQMLHPFELHFDRPAAKRYRLRVQARYPYRNHQWTYSPEEPIRRGETSVLLNLPVGFGKFFLDFWVLDGAEVVDWYTEVVDLNGWPVMSDIKFSASVVEPNDRIEVSLYVRGHYHRPRPCTVFVRATDSLGRLVASKHIRVGKEGGPVDVELPIFDLLTPYIKVEVYASDTTNATLSYWLKEHSDYAFAHVLVRRSMEDAFRFVADGDAGAEFNIRAQNRALARLGVDTLHASALRDTRATPALDNLDVIPSLESKAGAYCYSDPTFRRRQYQELSEVARRYELSGSGWYRLASDTFAVEGNDVPFPMETCASELGGFLARRYPDVGALNTAWGSDFEQWDAVSFPKSNQARTIAIQMDRAAFADYISQQAFDQARAIIRDVDTRARVGIASTPSSLGQDTVSWSALTRRSDLLTVPQDRLAVTKVMSYRKDGALALLRLSDLDFLGNSNAARWLPWYAVLHGLDGVWIGPGVGALLTNGPGRSKDTQRIASKLNELAHAVHLVQSGFAELLKKSQPIRSEIAVYDGRASILLDRVLPIDGYGTRQAQERFARLLEALGHNYTFVDYETLVEGGLAGYTVCILPFARALSDEELRALEQFHASGGALLADLLPGRYSEHGVFRAGSPLEDAFGIASRGEGRLGPMAPVTIPDGKKSSPKKTRSLLARADHSIEIVNAESQRAVNGIPIGLRSDGQGGHAMLLNYALAESNFPLALEIASWLDEKMRARTTPGFVVNRNVFEGESMVFTYSQARILGFLTRPDSKKKNTSIQLAVDEDHHAYNMLSGEYYGPGSRLSLRLKPGDTALVGLLPYEVSRVIVTAPNLVGVGRRLPVAIEIKTRGDLPGDHIVYLSVTGPAGFELPHYARTVECLNGRGDTYIPLALNDMPGAYAVSVRDLLTGVTASTNVDVR